MVAMRYYKAFFIIKTYSSPMGHRVCAVISLSLTCQFHRRTSNLYEYFIKNIVEQRHRRKNINMDYWGGHIIKQILHTLSYLISQFIPPR